mmetsp:Transcript_55207/g.49700  ORF Transcript_55207/g.49700 Transcript_55207/m.49700 type:complete len:370 (-) Transcript_55207:1294-2403(-)
MSENLEAPNPFNQHQLESGDSLKFEGGFWDEPQAQQRNGSAYDEDNNNAYGSSNNNNAYDEESDKQNKPNAITNLFNNMKEKLKTDNNDNDNDNGAYDGDDGAYGDDSWIVDEASKPSKSEGKSSNLLTTNQISMTHEQLNKKEAYLDRREQQLLERKKRLAAVKHELNSTNIRRDNWPCTYYPITFHSIQQEIPPHARSHMKRMYTLVLMTFFCFILNTFAQLILYFTDVGTDSDILLAVLYLFCGVCGAWRLWYRQIYYGIRDRKTLKWWCFFIFFFAHIGFCIVMTIGIEGWGGAGIITMVDAFNSKKSFAGFFCLVCSCLWSINALGSCFYMKRSWILFKQRGGIEASQGALANAVAQHAAEQLV